MENVGRYRRLAEEMKRVLAGLLGQLVCYEKKRRLSVEEVVFRLVPDGWLDILTQRWWSVALTLKMYRITKKPKHREVVAFTRTTTCCVASSDTCFHMGE